jgi:predicted RNA-binding Zn-ribbon protein involved in translation (DUF1610 family)
MGGLGAGSHERIRHGIPCDTVEYRAGLPSEHRPRPDTFGHERVGARWQELATDEKRQEREAIEKKMKRECQRGTEAGQATTDMFKCDKCGQRKVWRHKPCNMQHVLPGDCVQPEHQWFNAPHTSHASSAHSVSSDRCRQRITSCKPSVPMSP